MKTLLMTTAVLLASFTANAVTLGSCKGLDSVANVVSIHRLPDGNRLATVSDGFDAANTIHLLVISYGDDGYSSCVSINSDVKPNGFTDVYLRKMKLVVNAPGDMSIAVPTQLTDEKSGALTKPVIRFRIVDKYPSANVTLIKP